MPIASGSTAISKMYVGGTLVSAAYANSASLLFNPSSLFAASEQGAWYDPSDWSTLFQDSAGTTPVTAVGQPVGKMLDKSGRSNHATQPTAINRPVLQIDGSGRYYLALNGTNSWMSTPAINFTATNKMTVVAGVKKLSAAQSIICELSPIFSSNAGAFAMYSSRILVGDLYFASKGTSTSTAYCAGFPEGNSYVSTGLASVSDLLIILRVNGTQVSNSGLTQGSGNYGNHQLFIGMRAGVSLPFNGNLYGLVVRGALSTAPQIAGAETYMNSKTGAY